MSTDVHPRQRPPWPRWILVAVVGLIGAACGSAPPPSPTPPTVGEPAPDFALTAADGSDVTLEQVTADRSALLYFSMGPG